MVMYFYSVATNIWGQRNVPESNGVRVKCGSRPLRHFTLTPILLCLVIAVMLSGCTAAARRAPADINFTGVWKLDPELSGDPGSLPGILDVPIDKLGDAAPPPDLAERYQSRRLEIYQHDGQTSILYGDGPEESYAWGRYQRGPVWSGWNKTHFVVRRPGPDGHPVVRRYILSDGGDSITIVTMYNRMALSQFYELDKDATKQSFGNLVSVDSYKK